MSLLKTAFWICLVVMILPVGTDQSTDEAAPGNGALAHKAFGAAQATVSDLTSFCGRNPEVCETGGLAFDMFRDKAVATAGLIYRAIAGSGTDARQAPAPETRPVRVPPQSDTLTPADREAPWLGPVQGDA